MRCLLICSAVMLVNCSVSVADEETPSPPPRPRLKSPAKVTRAKTQKRNVVPLTDQQVKELIVDLDSSVYAARKRATSKLSMAGASAVPALVKATQNSSLEVSVRAVQILSKLYATEGDEDTVAKTELALEQLRLSKSHSVASRANDVLRRHYLTVRRPRAVAAIKKLGGKVYYREGTAAVLNGQADSSIAYVLLGKDWKGGENGLIFVRRLEGLPALYLIRGVPISEKAIETLERELPQMTIQYRGKAYLGISGQPGREGCLISRVVDGGAADKAGIVPGDEIVQFGKDPVTGFESLIDLIKKYGPGDSIKVIVRRNGTRTELTVKLTEWR